MARTVLGLAELQSARELAARGLAAGVLTTREVEAHRMVARA